MDAIVQVIKDWSHSKDQNLTVYAIFFDFAKAFDLVDHEVLLEKLQKLLPSWLVSWIAAYLSDRVQRVVVNNITTEWKKVEAGVIQGSVLGPILFLLFISDINDELPPGKLIPDGLQAKADAISNWCLKNKMRLNTEKCKTMVIHHYPRETHQTVLLNGHPLETVPAYKYLGVELSNTLDWNKQWDRVQKITNSTLSFSLTPIVAMDLATSCTVRHSYHLQVPRLKTK